MSICRPRPSAGSDHVNFHRCEICQPRKSGINFQLLTKGQNVKIHVNFHRCEICQPRKCEINV